MRLAALLLCLLALVFINAQQTPVVRSSKADILEYLRRIGVDVTQHRASNATATLKPAKRPHRPQEIDLLLSRIRHSSQNPQACLDHDDQIMKFASERDYNNITSCEALVRMIKLQGHDCTSGLNMFGYPELHVGNVCCASCTSHCIDHDSVAADVMSKLNHPEINSCNQTMSQLTSVLGVGGRKFDLADHGYPNLTLTDICCASARRSVIPKPATATKDKLSQSYVQADAEPQSPKSQFPNANGPASTEAREEHEREINTQQVAQVMVHERNIQVLEVAAEDIANKTELAASLTPNVVVGNRTLSINETLQFGAGYSEGFFLGYKTGFTLAEEDDLGGPAVSEEDKVIRHHSHRDDDEMMLVQHGEMGAIPAPPPPNLSDSE